MVSMVIAAVFVFVTGLSSALSARASQLITRGADDQTTKDDDQAAPPITEADLFNWVIQYSNWGRWGPDDQRGTDNFITPEKRVEATSLVRLGMPVPMARRPHKVAFDPQR